jgi:membrane protein DedA with SNARE-associated domain
MQFLDQVQVWIHLYGYFIIFPLAVVEGPMIAVLSGWMVSQGFLDDAPTFSVLLLGDLVGDALYYCVGRFGGRPIMGWCKGLIKKMEGHIIRLENHFKSHGAKTLYFGKTQAYGAAILAAAGAAKMPFLKFFLVSLSGSGVKITLLLLIGYFFGKSYQNINNYFYVVGLISFILLAVIVFVATRRETIKV